mmetsp:Transcript_62670/g.176697  ORF Transcript_62670/g.176697 Transcript_62670/m.176697 type:complete len:227 (-) Transcript_62670:130-810(-)
MHVLALEVEFLAGPAVPARGIDRGVVQLIVRCAEVDHEVEHLVLDPVHAGAVAITFVDHNEGLDAAGKRFHQHELGLGHGALRGVNKEAHTVHDRHHTLHLAAKVSVTGGVHDVELGVLPRHGGDLRHDGNAALALEVHGVHEAVTAVIVLDGDLCLVEQLVDQRGLAVVDVRDDGHVAQGFSRDGVVVNIARRSYHAERLPASRRRRRTPGRHRRPAEAVQCGPW